jgi:hypothetical protein
MLRECDVLVIGGGPAGLAAAVGAARAGDGPGAVVNAGLCTQFARRLSDAAGTSPIRTPGDLWILPHTSWAFERVADAYVEEHPQIELALLGVAHTAHTDGRLVTRVDALVWNQAVSFAPRAVIDCTGEATAATLAGAETEDLGDTMATSAIFTIDGVDTTLDPRALQLAALRDIARGVEEETLPPSSRHLTVVPAVNAPGQALVKVVLPSVTRDSWNRASHLALEARRQAEILCAHLRARCAPFREARIGQMAEQIGIRLGRSAVGRAALTEEDVLACRRSPDGVAVGAWPMEEWDADRGLRIEPLPEGGTYDIPLGCLRARDLDNLWMAGRCLSATARALASARVIGTALATGFAAGTAAAMTLRGESEKTIINSLRAVPESSPVSPAS